MPAPLIAAALSAIAPALAKRGLDLLSGVFPRRRLLRRARTLL